MKNKKWLILIITFALVGLIILSLYLYKNNNKTIKLKENEIVNIVETDVEIPSFTIILKGGYEGTITQLDLKEKGIKVYDFDAGINNGWEVKTNRYTGVKLKDVLEKMNINDFSTIKFKGAGKVEITYDAEEISDKTYLVFYRDGKILDKEESSVNLLAVDYQSRFSLQGLVIMTIL